MAVVQGGRPRGESELGKGQVRAEETESIKL